MNTTGTLDIYASGNEAAWRDRMRATFNAVRPGMGDGLRCFTNGGGEPAMTGRIPGTNTGEVTAIRQAMNPANLSTAIIISIGGCYGAYAHREPIGAWCLALCAYRRAVEGVT